MWHARYELTCVLARGEDIPVPNINKAQRYQIFRYSQISSVRHQLAPVRRPQHLSTPEEGRRQSRLASTQTAGTFSRQPVIRAPPAGEALKQRAAVQLAVEVIADS